MSRGGEVGPLQWGDAEYTFRLGIGEQRKVQERCDAGLSEIAARLAPLADQLANGMAFRAAVALGFGGRWRVDDVREVMLRGLVGGGLTEQEAAIVVRERIDEQLDFASAVPIAFAACLAGISGPEDEPLGEPQGEVTESRPSPEESCDSQPCTEPAPF